MGFPIYYCGTLLFRDGKPAFSTRCCCGPLIPCCGSCYFPVAFRKNPNPIENFEVGGPTQIVNMNFTASLVADNGTTDFIEWRQSGVSTHYTTSQEVDDNCVFRSRTYSRCFFSFPTLMYDIDGNRIQLETEDGFVDHPPISYFIQYDSDNLWRTEVAAIAGDLVSGTGQIAGNCNSGTWNHSYRFTNPPPQLSGVWTQIGSFEVTGAKPWPAGFECRGDSPNPSGNPALWNVAKNRWAVESDMPEGFL